MTEAFNQHNPMEITSQDTSPDPLLIMMTERITEVSNLVGIPIEASHVLLRHHNWYRTSLLDSYTKDIDAFKEDAGVYSRCNVDVDIQNKLHGNSSYVNESQVCNICFDDEIDMFGMSCGHNFCRGCWHAYISSQVNDGPSCIFTRCPSGNCKEMITEIEVEEIAPQLLSIYKSYQFQHFKAAHMTYCPKEGCDHDTILNESKGTLHDNGQNIIECSRCQTLYCVKCNTESHEPFSCSEQAKWNKIIHEFSSVITNDNRAKIKAFKVLNEVKQCPKCQFMIEKISGCRHMKCIHCRHEFCWVCLGKSVHQKLHVNCDAKQNLTDDQQQLLTPIQRENMRRSKYKNKIDEFAKKYIIQLTEILSDQSRRQDAIFDFNEKEKIDVGKTFDSLIQSEKVLRNVYAYCGLKYLSRVKDVNVDNEKEEEIEVNLIEFHLDELERVKGYLQKSLLLKDKMIYHNGVITISQLDTTCEGNFQRILTQGKAVKSCVDNLVQSIRF